MLPNTQPYFIAETAFHHEGDVQFLKTLVNDIVKTKTDAVKFHLLFDVADYMVHDHPALDVIKKIAIPKEHWPEVLSIVAEAGKDIILLSNDVASLNWINTQQQFKVKAIEIHSTGLNDIFLLQEAAKFKGTVIIGVGGSTFDEVKYAIDFLKQNGQYDIFLMHGFQNYPTQYKDINFRRMHFLQEAFELPVGYADHTDPNEENNAFISVVPQVMGFNVLEKHVTNVMGEKRIDAQAAVSFNTFQKIIELANITYQTRGEMAMEFSPSEQNYGNTGPMKKAIVAREKIKKDEVITLDKIAFRRTNASSPLLQKDLVKIVGGKALDDIDADEMLTFANVQYEFKQPDLNQFFFSEKK